MTRLKHILGHSPRGIAIQGEPSTPEVDEVLAAQLPAMPHDAELELGQGAASLEHEQREDEPEHKHKRKKGAK